MTAPRPPRAAMREGTRSSIQVLDAGGAQLHLGAGTDQGDGDFIAVALDQAGGSLIDAQTSQVVGRLEAGAIGVQEQHPLGPARRAGLR